MAKKKELTIEEQAIRDYAKLIKTINVFSIAVRQNPGQFIGYLRNKGFKNMYREIYQNAIDELIKDSSPCNEVKVFFDERDNSVMVEDNGRGIPHNEIIRIYTSEHTSSNYTKKKGEYSSGLHGVGGKVVNALSSIFTVDSYVLGEARHVEFYKGLPWKKGEQIIPNKDNKQGTVVMFKPDYEIMGEINVSWEEIYDLTAKILMLTKRGSKVIFKAIDKRGKLHEETIINEDGIITDLIKKTSKPLIAPVYIANDNGTMKAEIAFTYDSEDLNGENITTFSNFCPTIGGKHLDGFIDGLCTYWRKYMNSVYLANSKKKITVNANDIKQGLKAVISVAHIKPIFSGQAKDILDNDDMYFFCKDLVVNAMDNWLKTNQNEVKKLCELFKDSAEVRLNSEKEKVKLSSKYNTSKLTGMPAKFVKPEKPKKGAELIIVEGDSAMGPLRNNRDNDIQGLFPIRGKVPNAFNTSREKFLANEEIASMITIFGCGYGKNCDISKLKWKKIIIGTDADPDGAHIRTLLVKFILLYCPQIIQGGYLYAAVPPLYGVKVGTTGSGKNKRDKMKYFTEMIDYVKYVQGLFIKNNDLRDIKNKPMTKTEITAILYKNMDYIKELRTVSDTFAIDPLLLEYILGNITLPLETNKIPTLKRLIKTKGRFLDVRKEKNTIVIDGLYEEKYHRIFLNDKMIKRCQNLLDHINNTPKGFILNGNKITLYELMNAFEQSSPKGLKRYKGLGEMDGWQLFESTFDPSDTSNRTLIQYTMESAKEEIELMKILNNDTKALLNDIRIKKDDL